MFQDILLGVDTPIYTREFRLWKQEGGAGPLLTEGKAVRFLRGDLRTEGYNISGLDPCEDEEGDGRLVVGLCIHDPANDASWRAACKPENSTGSI